MSDELNPNVNRKQFRPLYIGSAADVPVGGLFHPTPNNVNPKGEVAATTSLRDATWRASNGGMEWRSVVQPGLFNTVYEVAPLDAQEATDTSSIEGIWGNRKPRPGHDEDGGRVSSSKGFEVTGVKGLVINEDALPEKHDGFGDIDWRESKKGTRPKRKHDN